MKIRNGFVSNSSSSSFVIYGVKIEDKSVEDIVKQFYSEEELKEFGEDDYWDLLYSRKLNDKIGFDILTDDIECWVGKIISESDESYMNDGEMSFEEIVEARDKLKEFFPDLESKIYAGERSN